METLHKEMVDVMLFMFAIGKTLLYTGLGVSLGGLLLREWLAARATTNRNR